MGLLLRLLVLDPALLLLMLELALAITLWPLQGNFLVLALNI
jgi:hypothetical protein